MFWEAQQATVTSSSISSLWSNAKSAECVLICLPTHATCLCCCRMLLGRLIQPGLYQKPWEQWMAGPGMCRMLSSILTLRLSAEAPYATGGPKVWLTDFAFSRIVSRLSACMMYACYIYACTMYVCYICLHSVYIFLYVCRAWQEGGTRSQYSHQVVL